MSSKLTELTDSSPSALPPSVLCGSGILSWLASPWLMASSGNFDPGQTYDCHKEVEVLDPPCTECLAKLKDCFQHFNPKSSKCHFWFVGKKPCCCPGSVASNIRRYLWSKKDGSFGKELPVSEGPTPDATSGYSDLTGSRQRDVARWTNVGGSIPVSSRLIYSSSAVPISRINSEGVFKRISRISDYPPDPDAEGSEEVGVVNNPVGHQSSTSPSRHPAKRFQSRLIPSTPRNFQKNLAAIPTFLPHFSPSSSHTRPAINPAIRPSPIVTSQKLQPEASSSIRREELLPFPFPAAQVFQQRDLWTIRVTREDPNTASENQDAVARLF
ncbi:hypothetical protein O181_025874 [Austropuccinia psidii MF-1]|uniref:Uncharacterized protein n=1 Tax=Austropuccinia psidii MF-1 TaxID=1389203 RepID=A0A9Q3H137_9BASI|nr:hypothetical protein [Austropuccinia psidii MF-1]